MNFFGQAFSPLDVRTIGRNSHLKKGEKIIVKYLIIKYIKPQNWRKFRNFKYFPTVFQMITKTPPEVLTTQKKLFMLRATNTKRQYHGTEALALGKRSVDKASQFFGESKNTVYSSIDEINSGYTPEPGRIRRSGGGRKQELNKHPEWFEILKLVIEPHTAGLPHDEDVIWISLSVPMITREMAKEGCNVSEYLVRQMLKQMGCRHRSFIKDLPMKDVKDRNAQLLNIAEYCRHQRKGICDRPSHNQY